MSRKTRQNRITSPELLAKVNPDNLRLKKDYLAYCDSVGRSRTTIDSYINDLDIYLCWNLLHNKNKFFIDMTKRDFVSYLGWLLNENQNSPARVRRLRSTLCSLSNYIEAILDDEYPDFKPIVKRLSRL